MALGGATITWAEGTPSGTSQAGLGDDEFKSIKTSVRNAMDSEHIWPSTGGAGTGAHRLGSARAFYGTASQVSSSDTDGRFMLTSDTSRLYHVSSATTMFLGGQYAIEAYSAISRAGTATASKVTQIWTMETGSFTMQNASTGTVITLRQTYVEGQVFVSAFGNVTSVGGVPMSSGVITATNQVTVLNYGFTGAQASSTTTYSCQYLVVGFKAG